MYPSSNTLLISGTDTEIGKTLITAALLAYGQAYYPEKTLAIFKPLQTGGGGDRDYYQQHFDLKQTPAELNPVAFQAPLAPPLAAALENRDIDLGLVWSTLQQLQQNYDYVLVEGIGGLGTPITWEWTVADLAAAWRLPIILIVPVRLGSLGQAVAHVALARQQGLVIRGLVRNCLTPCSATEIDQWTNAELLQTLTQVPVLGTMPYIPERDNLGALKENLANFDLSKIFGN